MTKRDEKTKYVIPGYVHSGQADGKHMLIAFGEEGSMEIKSPIGLWDLYCHKVRITIEDLGNPDVPEVNAEFLATLEKVSRLAGNEEQFRAELVTLIQGRPKHAADVVLTWRRRVFQYREMQDVENGKVIAKLAADLDLDDKQLGRLQVLVRESNERLKETIREYDEKSPALHPADVG